MRRMEFDSLTVALAPQLGKKYGQVVLLSPWNEKKTVAFTIGFPASYHFVQGLVLILRIGHGFLFIICSNNA